MIKIDVLSEPRMGSIFILDGEIIESIRKFRRMLNRIDIVQECDTTAVK